MGFFVVSLPRTLVIKQQIIRVRARIEVHHSDTLPLPEPGRGFFLSELFQNEMDDANMQLNVLKAKIHRATVTHAELHYEGSCAIDENLLEASGIFEYEQIHIYNVNNGERFVTYAIRAEAGSGVISVNGAAAHKASPGDLLIICAYGTIDEAERSQYRPRLVYPDANNVVERVAGEIPVQAA